MLVVYQCYGGSHSSVTSAALHLGLLDARRLPSPEELVSLPFFDKTCNADFGRIRLLGMDSRGNLVYVLSRRNLGSHFTRVLLGIAEIAGIKEKVMLVNTFPYVNWLMMLGGFISRRLGFSIIGRPVLIKGTQKAFFDLAALVQDVKERLK